MAVFLQRTNQPASTPASWGGCFTCCFSKPQADADEGYRNARQPPTNVTVNEAPKTPVPTMPTTNGERIQPPEIVISPGSGASSPAPSRTPSMASKPSRTPSIASKTPTETADKHAFNYAPDGQAGQATPNKAPTETADKTASNYAPDEQAGKAVPNKAPSEAGSKTGPNYGLTNPHASRGRLPSGSSDKPAPDGIQAMYEHWGGSKTASKESIPHAVGAAGSHPPSISAGGSLTGTEFAEEPYNHNLKWDEGSNFHPLGRGQDKGSVISLASRPGIVTRIKFDFKESVLQIHFGQVSKAPTRANGGASAYQVRIAILMKRKKRWHSKVHNSPDPIINETAVFKDMNLDELHKTGLRIRLYSIEKMHRHKIFGETVIPFTSLNLRTETTYPITLEYRSHKLGVESDSDLSDSLSRLSGASHRVGSRLSLRSRHSSTGSRTAEAPPQQTVAESVAKSKNADWPELLIGLSYSQQTGRLNITAVKASKLKIPGAPSAIPKTFISVSLMAKTGEKITAAKTKAAHTSSNPEYGEKFSFEVPAVQINNVVLFFRVYHKHKVHKDENIGWFAIGCSNSGSEEEAHWRDMLAASGQEIMRWHTLNEDVR
ncbi:clathrin binding [Sparganum proliferum]